MTKRKSPPTEFEIDRALWLTGEIPEISYLRSEKTGRMCCLGIYAKACGVPNKFLVGGGLPENVPVPHSDKLPGWLMSSEGYDVVGLLVRVNDDKKLSRKEREDKIAGVFATEGVRVKFVGRYPSKKQLKEDYGKSEAE